ncbi:MAG: methyltransferase domain-containing protein [Myxococcales bacterium]|nr:methyltransferase domain-containing protein [Myxococcales bacterium]
MECEGCGHASFERAGGVPDVRYGVPSEMFDVMRCRGCGLVRTAVAGEAYDPAPHYGQQYGAFVERALPPVPGSGRKLVAALDSALLGVGVARQRLSVLRTMDITADTRVLDVGCGSGEIARAVARAYGCRVRGIEPDAGAASTARAHGVEVFVGRAEDYRPEQKVDLALMIHSLEHVSHPAAVLSTLHASLEGDGALIVAVPNYRSLERLIFRRYWDAWDVPRHVHHYTPRTLGALLRACGFAPRQTYYEMYSVLGRSLGNLLHRGAYERRKSRVRLGRLESAWGLAQALLHQSSAMTIVANRI